MYSKLTNANKYSIVLITSLVLLIGLVGLFAINSPKNIVANALTDNYGCPINSYIPPSFNYENASAGTGMPGTNVFQTSGWSWDVCSLSGIPAGNYKDYVSFSYPRLYNFVSNQYSYEPIANWNHLKIINTYSTGLFVKTPTYSCNNSYVQLYFWMAFMDNTNHSSLIHQVRFYDINNETVGNSAFWIDTSGYVNNKWYILDLEPSNIPSTAVKFSSSIEFPIGSCAISSFYMGPGNRTAPEHVSTLMDLGNILDNIPDPIYFENLYLQSQENLRLAQEEGATLNGALESITTAPINALAEFMTFELPFFNINLGTILAILVSLMLVAFVVKIFISKG